MMKYEVECQLYIYWVLTTWLELGHMDCEVFFEGDVRDELLLMTLTRFCKSRCIIRTSVSRAVEEDRNIPAALYPGMGLHRASRGRRTSWGGKVKKVAAMDGGWQEQGAFSEERGSSSSSKGWRSGLESRGEYSYGANLHAGPYRLRNVRKYGAEDPVLAGFKANSARRKQQIQG
uniref:Uncharacterized protein n=2 Tax=Oryza meridionalis TaxID=40149 RepID=A0A0E0DII3_9ORYZ